MQITSWSCMKAVAELGTHNELLELRGRYATLYRQQEAGKHERQTSNRTMATKIHWSLRHSMSKQFTAQLPPDQGFAMGDCRLYCFGFTAVYRIDEVVIARGELRNSTERPIKAIILWRC